MSGGGAEPWLAEDVEKFLARHGPGTMARLWFCLAYDSHGRIGDMHRLGSNNEALHDGERYLEWQPSKKGSAVVSIPLGEILSTELALHDERDTYLLTELGKPSASSDSIDSRDNRVRKWTIATGLCIDAKDEERNPIDVGKGKREVVNKFAARSNHEIRIDLTALMVKLGTMGNEMMASFGWTEPKAASN